MVWGVEVYGLGCSRSSSFLCLVVFQDDGTIAKTPPGYQNISI
jgi:hypothetical protein